MAQASVVHNPFMLLISPEVVLAAMEKSEHLSQLNRHLCRPLDRQTPAGTAGAEEGEDADVPETAN